MLACSQEGTEAAGTPAVRVGDKISSEHLGISATAAAPSCSRRGVHSPTRSAGSNSLTCTRASTGQIPGLARGTGASGQFTRTLTAPPPRSAGPPVPRSAGTPSRPDTRTARIPAPLGGPPPPRRDPSRETRSAERGAPPTGTGKPPAPECSAAERPARGPEAARVPVRGAWFPAETVPQQRARALGSGPHPAPPADPEPAGGNPSCEPSPPPTRRPREPAIHAPPRARSPGCPDDGASLRGRFPGFPFRLPREWLLGRRAAAPFPPRRPSARRPASSVCAAPEGGARLEDPGAAGPTPCPVCCACEGDPGWPAASSLPAPLETGSVADPASPAGHTLAEGRLLRRQRAGVDTLVPRMAPRCVLSPSPLHKRTGGWPAAFPKPGVAPLASPAAAF
ncbi:proline-rich protein 2-like [Enhydra lutris kenyoni]|uniref:Proline-rich protein 2-like n=1 Tax=Enhydra lutris kenyoni TaxID=391180 RepID=A0A2Y9INK3_ENHLU|nr:proline-rich protein 2-like [Enhydra lutris kenyoni]